MSSATALDDDLRLRSKMVACDLSKATAVSGSKRVIALIGFPFDEGCARNGGRPGAKDGPKVFRRHLQRTGTVPNPETGCDFDNLVIWDCGDIDAALDYDGAHDALQRTVDSAIRLNALPFVIGGSNDQSYFNARALMDVILDKAKSKTTTASGGDTVTEPVRFGVINLDAHFDVRPKKKGLEHSGSPFRQLLEDKDFDCEHNSFVEFAAQSHQCSEAHLQWILARKPATRVVWTKDLREDAPKSFDAELAAMRSDNIFVSFDIDAISQAHCPGVSCPSPLGLEAKDAIDICFSAGKNPSVKLVDFSEFNPVIEDYNTGKLVAAMFYYFAMGVSMR